MFDTMKDGKNTGKTIKYTRHAEIMLKERNISKAMVKSAIDSPKKQLTNSNGILHYFKKIDEKYLRVVVRVQESIYIIITTYFDRRMKE